MVDGTGVDVSTAVMSAATEIDYETGVGDFGQNFSVSIPCQLRFTDAPSQDTERFHAALEDRGYSPLDPNADRQGGENPDGVYYDGGILSGEPHKRFRVVVFRGDKVRLFPKDGFVPSPEQLQVVVNAIEEGFGASVEHAPIE